MAIHFELPEPSRLTPVREDPDAYFAHAWERALDEAQESLERESSEEAYHDTDGPDGSSLHPRALHPGFGP